MPAPGSVDDVPVGGHLSCTGAHFVTLPVPSCGHPVHTAVLSVLTLGLDVAVQSAVPRGDPSVLLHGRLGPQVIVWRQRPALRCFGMQSVQRTPAGPPQPSPSCPEPPSAGSRCPKARAPASFPCSQVWGQGRGGSSGGKAESRPLGQVDERVAGKLTGSRRQAWGRSGRGGGPGDPGLSSGPVNQEPKLEKTQAFIVGSRMATQGAQAPGGPEGRARGVVEAREGVTTPLVWV